MAWCLNAAVISAGSSCGCREERLASIRRSCTARTEPLRYDCTTCTSTTVVRRGGGGGSVCELHLKEERKNQQRGRQEGARG